MCRKDAKSDKKTQGVKSYSLYSCIFGGYNYLYLRFLAASDFFLRFTLGFS